MKVELTPYAKTVQFATIPIGQLFVGFDTMWTRTDRYVAVDIAGKYGACHFEFEDNVYPVKVEKLVD